MSEKIDQTWNDTARRVETDVAADVAATTVETEMAPTPDMDVNVDTEPDRG
jgi:hypothetical protein